MNSERVVLWVLEKFEFFFFRGLQSLKCVVSNDHSSLFFLPLSLSPPVLLTEQVVVVAILHGVHLAAHGRGRAGGNRGGAPAVADRGVPRSRPRRRARGRTFAAPLLAACRPRPPAGGPTRAWRSASRFRTAERRALHS